MQNFFDIFSTLSFRASSVADLLFLLVTIFAATASLILFFHWKKYGMGGAVLAMTETVYFAVAVVLLSVAFFALK